MEVEVEKACVEQKAELNSEFNLVEEENGTCVNCGGKDILRDSCASEDVLVCRECGFVMEAGSIDDRKDPQDYIAPIRPSKPTTARGGPRLRFGNPESTRVAKWVRLMRELGRIADKMRLQEHMKKMCLEKLSDFMNEHDQVGHTIKDSIIAGGIIFIFATDQSPMSFRKVKSIINVNGKRLRKMIKQLKQLSSFKPACIPPREATVQEVMIDHIESLEIVTDLSEKKQCITLASGLWELLQTTDLEQNLVTCNPILLSAIVVTALEYIRKCKTHKELIQCVAKKVDIASFMFKRHCSQIRINLYKLAIKVPSLESEVQARKLTSLTVLRYLPTIINNKTYLFADRTLTNREKKMEEEKRKNQESEESSTRITGTPCVPIPEFNWTEDESLSDVDDGDIDQYLAGQEEIDAKKQLYES